MRGLPGSAFDFKSDSSGRSLGRQGSKTKLYPTVLPKWALPGDILFPGHRHHVFQGHLEGISSSESHLKPTVSAGWEASIEIQVCPARKFFCSNARWLWADRAEEAVTEIMSWGTCPSASTAPTVTISSSTYKLLMKLTLGGATVLKSVRTTGTLCVFPSPHRGFHSRLSRLPEPKYPCWPQTAQGTRLQETLLLPLVLHTIRAATAKHRLDLLELEALTGPELKTTYSWLPILPWVMRQHPSGLLHHRGHFIAKITILAVRVKHGLLAYSTNRRKCFPCPQFDAMVLRSPFF